MRLKKCPCEIHLSREFLSSIQIVAKIVFAVNVSSKNTYADDLDILYHIKSMSLHSRVCLKCWLEKSTANSKK